MGQTASVNRQGGSTMSTLYRRQANATAASRESYTPAQMQALYLSHGRPDMAFISNQTGNMPVGLPELQQTCTVKSNVSLKKTSLKLQRLTETQHYDVEFQFDALKPCRISVYLMAADTIDADTGGSSFALVYANKIPVLTQHFPSGLEQVFALSKGERKEDKEKDAHMVSFLDLSMYDSKELLYKAGTTQFPLIILLEVTLDKKRLQSQSTFCTLYRKDEDSWDIKVLKQQVLVNGQTYELQEIYGINGLVTAAPRTEQNNGIEDEADRTQTTEKEMEIPERAECIICFCEPRNTTILPCRHMCLCKECAEALRKSSRTCPICRTQVEALLQICVNETKETKAI